MKNFKGHVWGCLHNTLGAEVGGSQVQGQPGLLARSCLKKKKIGSYSTYCKQHPESDALGIWS